MAMIVAGKLHPYLRKNYCRKNIILLLLFFLLNLLFILISSSRYPRGGNEYDYGNDYDDSSRAPKSRFRSRFVRSHQQDDSDSEQNRAVRFHEKDKEKERERVLDTEFVSRGNLSGIIRLADSPRVMKRLQESDRPKKEKKEQIQPITPKPIVQPKRPTATPVAQRQMSEDEIDRIKRQNKGSTSSTTTTTAPVAPAIEPERY